MSENIVTALIAERDRMRMAYENTNLSEMNRHGAFQSMCALNRVLAGAYAGSRIGVKAPF